jgi:hypothetical protein
MSFEKTVSPQVWRACHLLGANRWRAVRSGIQMLLREAERGDEDAKGTIAAIRAGRGDYPYRQEANS